MRDVTLEDIARRSDVVALAQQMFLLQIGHHGSTWLVDEKDQADQDEVYRKMARQTLSAAEAFVTESRKEGP